MSFGLIEGKDVIEQAVNDISDVTQDLNHSFSNDEANKNVQTGFQDKVQVVQLKCPSQVQSDNDKTEESFFQVFHAKLKVN